MDINKKIRIFKKPVLYITWKHIYIAVTVLISLIAAVLVTMTAWRFVRIGEISIVGMNPYDRSDIIEALAVRDDRLWLSIDERELEEKLIREKQLLGKVEVTKKFPNKLEIKIVESRLPRWYVEIADRKYTLDADLYVIEETKEVDGVTKLILPYVTELIQRKVPVFGQSENEVLRTLKIIDAVRGSEIRGRITELDVSNPNDITMVIDGKFIARLGGPEDTEGKLMMITLTLETDAVKNSKGGELIAYTYSQNGYASFKPITE